MEYRVTKKSNGKYSVQKKNETIIRNKIPFVKNDIIIEWVELANNFSTVVDAESYLINDLGIDIKEEVVATYFNNVKKINP